MSVEEREAIERAGLNDRQALVISLRLGLHNTDKVKVTDIATRYKTTREKVYQISNNAKLHLIHLFIAKPIYYELLPYDSPLRELIDLEKIREEEAIRAVKYQVKSILLKRKDKSKRVKNAEKKAKAYKERQAKIIAHEKAQEAFREATLAKHPYYSSYDKSKDIERYTYLKSIPLITEDDILLLANAYGLFGKTAMTPEEFKSIFGGNGVTRLRGAIYVLNNSPSSQKDNDIS